jgi:hypothetical protein
VYTYAASKPAQPWAVVSTIHPVTWKGLSVASAAPLPGASMTPSQKYVPVIASGPGSQSSSPPNAPDAGVLSGSSAAASTVRMTWRAWLEQRTIA